MVEVSAEGRRKSALGPASPAASPRWVRIFLHVDVPLKARDGAVEVIVQKSTIGQPVAQGHL